MPARELEQRLRNDTSHGFFLPYPPKRFVGEVLANRFNLCSTRSKAALYSVEAVGTIQSRSNRCQVTLHFRIPLWMMAIHWAAILFSIAAFVFGWAPELPRYFFAAFFVYMFVSPLTIAPWGRRAQREILNYLAGMPDSHLKRVLE